MKIVTRKALWAIVFCFFTINVCAQTTITIGPGNNWTDVCLLKSNQPDRQFYANTNYASYANIAANAWTASGHTFFRRSLIKFNLSAIPEGSTITSAILHLYSDPAHSGTVDADGNSKLSGSNALYLEKVTANWGETSVTWNNQPASTAVGRIWFPASTSTTENIQINIKSFVENWVNSPTTNYGMKMKLENELHYRSRNYASEDHSNPNIRPKLVITYLPPADSDPIKDRMDHIFGGLDQSYINTGILTDYGIDLADHTLFDGAIRPDNEMDMNSWRALYGSLLSAVTNPSSNMIHLRTINQTLEDHGAGYDRDNPIVDLPTLFVRYQSLREDAISQNLISVQNERLLDVPGRPQSPYTTAYAFATAPNLSYDTDGDVTFIFRSSLFVNSSTKTFSSFQVDFDDGAGYQTMAFDTPKNILYSTPGSKTLRFKIQFTDNSTYYSHAMFNILEASSGMAPARYNGSGARAYTFPRNEDVGCPENFPNPQAWQNSFYGATVTVEYGNMGSRTAPGCSPQFIKPLIVVEGFDPSKFKAFGIPNNNFVSFINNRNNGAINMRFSNNSLFNDALEDAGYDLIFIDFNEGTGDIIRNAYLVENVIQWVNAHKVVNPNTGLREKNVVWGQSMGGLVARYAVCDLEKRWNTNPVANPNHEVRLLVTHDAPHRGANVPLGFQALVNEMAPYKLTKIGLASYGIAGAIVGSFLEIRDIVPALDQAKKLLEEPAAKQMLIVQDGKTNTFLDGAYRNMVTFSSGYTPSFDMKALSNGSECGERQLTPPGGELLYADANLFVSRLLFFSTVEGASTTIGATNPGLGIISRTGLYALTPFIGKKWKTKYIVRAAPTSGTNQAFYGHIKLEKKILFLVPVNINLFSSSRNSIAGTLPWDSAPGGYYDLQDFRARFPGDPNINLYPLIQANLTIRLAPTFNFVPTVSALDIAPNPIPIAALSSPFNNGVNPVYPSRFNDFITQENDISEVNGSRYNSRHIQFTSRNAEWLLNEMEAVPNNTLNCSAECTPAGITLSGSSSICGEDQTYTLSIIPAGQTVNWTMSPGLVYVSGQNTNNYTVRKAGSSMGPFWVEAALDGPCEITYRKNISVIIPEADVNLSGETSPCPNEFYWYDVIVPVDFHVVDYIWSLPTGWTLVDEVTFYDNFVSIEVWTGNQIYQNQTVWVDIVTGCGSRSYSYPVQMMSCASSYDFTVHPNPASDYFEVSRSLSEDNINSPAKERETFLESQGEKGSAAIAVKLYNSKQEAVISMSFAGSALRVDTKGLPDGHYILHIISKEGIHRRHLYIEKGRVNFAQ